MQGVGDRSEKREERRRRKRRRRQWSTSGSSTSVDPLVLLGSYRVSFRSISVAAGKETARQRPREKRRNGQEEGEKKRGKREEAERKSFQDSAHSALLLSPSPELGFDAYSRPNILP